MDHKFKSKWLETNNYIYDQKDYYGFSWPQRNFMCNFCNKEYKSAQALGGHMNVHRRDRAKLRLSSPPPPLADDDQLHQPANPNNSNPAKCVSPPSPVRYQPYKTTYHPSLFPHHVSTTNIEDEQSSLFACSGGIDFLGCMGKKNGRMGDGEKEEERNGIKVWKKAEIFNMKMEMEMGLLNKDGKNIELDLELRLGRS